VSDKLILTIEIQEMGTEGWRENIERVLDDLGDTFEEALLWDITETLARADVHIVFCGVPGDKSMNDDFEVFVKPGRIVGATLEAES
jgi:hypothetical protein